MDRPVEADGGEKEVPNVNKFTSEMDALSGNTSQVGLNAI